MKIKKNAPLKSSLKIRNFSYCFLPESDDNGRGLCASCDQSDDEEEDEEGDERVAGAITLP